ncbi:MAG: TolC family protein [Desulforhopalus sp.]
MYLSIQVFSTFFLVFYCTQIGLANEPTNLSLDSIVSRALRYNRNLKSTSLDLSDSKITLQTAKDVFDIKVDPLSSINYSSSEDEDETVWQIGGEIKKKFKTGIDVKLLPSVEKGNEEYESGLGFSLAVPLLRGLGRDIALDNVFTQEYGLDASYRSLHRQRVNTMLETVSEVYSLIEEQELVNLYEDQLKALKWHLQSTIIKERAGIARSMDVYRAEIRINDVEASLNQAKQRVADTSDRLKDLVALPFHQSINVSAPLEYTFISLDQNKAVQIALKNRIEIHQGRADIFEASRKEKVAKHNTLPDLKLEVGYTRRGISTNSDDIYLLRDDFWSAGLTSNTDFARSAEKNAWRKSRLAVERQKINFETLQKNIAQEVRSVLNSLVKAKERILLQREQIIQATGKQRLAQIKFQYNEADNFDLIEAQTQLEQAKINLMSNEIQYIINGYRLRASMGTLIAYVPKN